MKHETGVTQRPDRVTGRRISWMLGLPALILALGFASSPALAGYRDGRAAYKAKNYAKAAEEFRKAAERGSARAQYYLGLMYRRGNGVTADDAEARRWFLKASERGHAIAQATLASLMRRGKGGPKELVEAYKWLSLSLKKRPSEKHAHNLRSIEKRLTYAEIAEAKKWVENWRPISRKRRSDR